MEGPRDCSTPVVLEGRSAASGTLITPAPAMCLLVIVSTFSSSAFGRRGVVICPLLLDYLCPLMAMRDTIYCTRCVYATRTC